MKNDADGETLSGSEPPCRRAGGRRRQAEIGGHRLETELRCDFKSAEKWATTSYDLNRSIGDMLQVDRGYLMVAHVGGRRNVKAPKVVGFTNTLHNSVATDVCPEWSTWVERAATVSAVRGAGGSPCGRPPGRSARTMEHTTLMVKERPDDGRVSITDLTGVGETAATIPSSEFTITPSVLEKAGRAYVTIQAKAGRFPAGLYEGSLVAGNGGKQAPALFYVSHTQLAGD